MTEFILPPPHPSVKEREPRGALSYDQGIPGEVCEIPKFDFFFERLSKSMKIVHACIVVLAAVALLAVSVCRARRRRAPHTLASLPRPRARALPRPLAVASSPRRPPSFLMRAR